MVCNVGQGDGLVIRTGSGQAMVIDAGPEPDAMDSCLDSLGVESVGLLVLTHMHLDHYGGLDGVLDGRRVARVLVGSSKKELPDLLTRAADAVERVLEVGVERAMNEINTR